MTTPQTRRLLYDVNCRRNPGITAVEDVDRIGTGETKSFMPSLRTLEKISAGLGVGVQRLLTLNSSEVALEDSFVQEIRPFLPRLNARQRELVLRTLQAAPKNQRQPKSW